MGKGFVLQEWMSELSWKQQSVILSGLRGPDNFRPPFTKKLNRWLRKVTQHDADSSTEYMMKVDLPTMEELCSELDYTTIHYFSHLINALEIIGYKHPDKENRRIANEYYAGLVKSLHLNPETSEQMGRRLEDKV